MRCESCNKFASLELQDPEVSDEKYVVNQITAQVRVFRTCADCSTELKETTFDVELTVDFCDPEEEGHGVELTANLSQLEEGGGRYKKSYFGFDGTFDLKCTCGKTLSTPASDKIAAGDMDEL